MTTEDDRVTALVQITDHEAAGLALLPRQHRTAAALRSLLRAWLTQVQAIEDALWAMLEQASLDDALGAQLDQIGALLLLPRGALADDTAYRALLRAIVRARWSRGTAEDVIAVLALALGGTDFAYREGHASILLEPHAPLALDAAALLYVLKLAKAGGVQLELLDPPAAETALFTLSTDPFRVVADAARGFADEADLAVGGQLTGVIS